MLGALFVLGSLGAIAAGSLAARSARLRTIEEAFLSLGGEPERKLWSVVGPVRGLLVHYEPYTGNRNRARTVCRVVLPMERPPFEMDLRPETRWEARDVEHGRAIDLVLGDPPFDDSFIVEAAPAEHGRALIDVQTRTALLTFHPCRLTVLGRELRFTKPQALSEFAEIRRVLELCTDVSRRLATMPAQFEEERLAQAREAATGYRGPSPETIHALATSSRSASELAALQQMRARRTKMRSMQAAFVVALGIVVYLLLAATARR
jgi:hypothetical protein